MKHQFKPYHIERPVLTRVRYVGVVKLVFSHRINAELPPLLDVVVKDPHNLFGVFVPYGDDLHCHLAGELIRRPRPKKVSSDNRICNPV